MATSDLAAVVVSAGKFNNPVALVAWAPAGKFKNPAGMGESPVRSLGMVPALRVNRARSHPPAQTREPPRRVAVAGWGGHKALVLQHHLPLQALPARLFHRAAMTAVGVA